MPNSFEAGMPGSVGTDGEVEDPEELPHELVTAQESGLSISLYRHSAGVGWQTVPFRQADISP
jgi:hypothetical protein